MEIYCIRHGQTVANVENIKGLSDTVLTKPGIEQAEELVSHLNKE
ncbi:MAG: histidine phosphatase family protein, partial [bacterium]|nr:histidine phosphatase family protein [bacterium]